MNIVCYCPTAQRYFRSFVQQIEQYGHQHFAWIACPLCDRYGRVATHALYDVRIPQWHCQQIDASHIQQTAYQQD